MTVTDERSDLHRIRLAGVWEIARSPETATSADRAPHEDDGGPDGWTRIRLDRLETGRLPIAATRFRRFFNRPTNLAAGQPVYLEWRRLFCAVRICVNGRLAIQVESGAEFVQLRIDDRLVERNQVTVETLHREAFGDDGDEEACAVWPFGECALVIAPSRQK